MTRHVLHPPVLTPSYKTFPPQFIMAVFHIFLIALCVQNIEVSIREWRVQHLEPYTDTENMLHLTIPILNVKVMSQFSEKFFSDTKTFVLVLSHNEFLFAGYP